MVAHLVLVLALLLQAQAAEALREPELCYVLDAILFIYGVVLTVLYCHLKVQVQRASKDRAGKEVENERETSRNGSKIAPREVAPAPKAPEGIGECWASPRKETTSTPDLAWKATRRTKPSSPKTPRGVTERHGPPLGITQQGFPVPWPFPPPAAPGSAQPRRSQRRRAADVPPRPSRLALTLETAIPEDQSGPHCPFHPPSSPGWIYPREVGAGRPFTNSAVETGKLQQWGRRKRSPSSSAGTEEALGLGIGQGRRPFMG
ncbi:high affinity immunoglobulin epsilon receptor subunit gamma isoform X1 [Rhea pennata]|uniref:high affinity immunoglobulin epsilon receptor subunit gamma isoform X1 n=1 Tax=Rhea pennata TaxID=8795 RepID=UPI002E25EF65